MHISNFKTSRKLVMLMGDIILISIAYILSVALVLNRSVIVENTFVYTGLLPVLMSITGLLLNINGLYTILYRRFADVLLGTLAAHVCTMILVMALSFWFKEYAYSRWVLITALILQCIFLVFWRYVLWRAGRKMLSHMNIMLIGSKEECSRVYYRLQQQPQLNLKMKYICTDLSNDRWKIAVENVEAVLLCNGIDNKSDAEIINYCYLHGRKVMFQPDMSELLCIGAELDKIDDIPVFRLHNLQPSLEVRTMKRILDICVSFIGFVCALPFMAATAVAIKIWDPGPMLYSQIRTGKNGKDFKIYKFRTMRVDAEKYSGPMLAKENDPRITRLGRFLRAVRLDELPQIWNVLNGDMSIVGPRPERPFFVEKFTTEMPEYAYRHNVKPGITGMAQVYGKYNTTAFDKLVYDLMYIQQCSILADLSIIIQTVKVLFTKSATEGTGVKQEKLDIDKYGIDKE